MIQHFNIIFHETAEDSDVSFKVSCKTTCLFRQLLDTMLTVTTTFIQQMSATTYMRLERFRNYDKSKCKIEISRNTFDIFTKHYIQRQINNKEKNEIKMHKY